MIRVGFKHLSPNCKMPTYATAGSACFDLYASETVILYDGRVAPVSLGFAIEIPDGYEMQIRSRSGMAKNGIIIANGIGTIDSDYRGEVKVLLLKLTLSEATTCVRINVGDRIAQGIICQVLRTEFEEAIELGETLRGEGGFGSTGN
jgi:dUTP pyrophosphatase